MIFPANGDLSDLMFLAGGVQPTGGLRSGRSPLGDQPGALRVCAPRAGAPRYRVGFTVTFGYGCRDGMNPGQLDFRMISSGSSWMLTVGRWGSSIRLSSNSAAERPTS